MGYPKLRANRVPCSSRELSFLDEIDAEIRAPQLAHALRIEHSAHHCGAISIDSDEQPVLSCGNSVRARINLERVYVFLMPVAQLWHCRLTKFIDRSL